MEKKKSQFDTTQEFQSDRENAGKSLGINQASYLLAVSLGLLLTGIINFQIHIPPLFSEAKVFLFVMALKLKKNQTLT